ncbi:hypothetical protein H0H92_006456 [Tricholoma furcatifolium]|nr:hypothetical protein H0H92_006456 [Tricholoma furcatifolium]
MVEAGSAPAVALIELLDEQRLIIDEDHSASGGRIAAFLIGPGIKILNTPKLVSDVKAITMLVRLA